MNKETEKKEKVRTSKSHKNSMQSQHTLFNRNKSIDFKCQSETRMLKYKKTIEKKRDLVWNREDMRDFQEMELELDSNEFCRTSFMFRLWSVHNHEKSRCNSYSNLYNLNQDDQYYQVKYVDNRLVGECSISMNKIYRDDFHAYDMNEDQDYVYSKIEKNIQDRIYFHGQQVGNFKIKLSMYNSPFIQQMVYGVRTEHGRQIGTYLFGNQEQNDLQIIEIKNVLKERKSLD